MITKNNDIRITDVKIETAKNKIPELDFVDNRFDVSEPHTIRGIFYLLSTPRSGSTMMCDLLYKSGFCLAHEYFQPFEYLPILSSRWGCLKNEVLNKEKFVNQLIRFRTLKSGWLGINLHGSHLPIYLEFEKYFPSTEKIIVRIKRNNIIEQAISYEIANQTHKWSSEFETNITPTYSFNNIIHKINDIHQQEIITDAFMSSSSNTAIDISYEDLAFNPKPPLESIIPREFRSITATTPSITKQSSPVNKEWIDRFTDELLKTHSEGCNALINRQPQNISHIQRIYNYTKRLINRQ